MRVELVLVGEASPAARTTPTHTGPLWDHRQPGVLTAVTAHRLPDGLGAAVGAGCAAVPPRGAASPCS
jgi:hypothetical protein